MSIVYDPIAELRKLGYTEREAAFLYMVGMHCGYFLRRQYLQFLRREDGAMVQRFLEKSIEREHVHAIEYAHGRHIFHLKSKTVYRVLDQENSQNRRAKADTEIKARLMQLDYLLDHFGDTFLETTERKVQLFHDKLDVPLSHCRGFSIAAVTPPMSSSGISWTDSLSPFMPERTAKSRRCASFMSIPACVRCHPLHAGWKSAPRFSLH